LLNHWFLPQYSRIKNVSDGTAQLEAIYIQHNAALDVEENKNLAYLGALIRIA